MVGVEFDGDKCKSPLECRRCLEVCGHGVLLTYPRANRNHSREAKDWVIQPTLISRCVGCFCCQEVCPLNAIKITPGMRVEELPPPTRGFWKRLQEFWRQLRVTVRTFLQ